MRLNKFNDHSIWCHYEHDNNELIYKFIKEYKTNVIAIPEKCGIALLNNELEVFGTEKCNIFNELDKKEI